MKNISKETWFALAVFGAIIGAPFAVQAATMTLVANGSPVGAVTASTIIMFGVSGSGVVNPVYSVSDGYSGQGATRGTIDNAGYFTWTPSVYDGGWHDLTFSVTDATNAVATTSVRILVAATNVFAQDIAPGTTIAVGRTLTFTPYAPGFTAPTFVIYDRTSGSSITPSTMNASTGQFSWTPAQDDIGTHTLLLNATDSNGNSAQKSFTISVINPKVSVTSFNSVVGVGSLSLFTAISSGLINPSWSVTDTPSGNATTTSIVAGDVSSSGVFSWTPKTSDIGTHAITITATDIYGNTASITVTIFVTASSANTLTTAVSPALPSTPSQIITAQTATVAPSAANAAAPQSSTTYQFSTYLSLGSKGAEVTALQQALTQKGVYDGPVSGYFGAMTKTAVEAFQKTHGLSSVGSVGPQTRALLNQVDATTRSGNTGASVASSSSSLTSSQVSAIISLLQAFNADATTIAQVQAALGQ